MNNGLRFLNGALVIMRDTNTSGPARLRVVFNNYKVEESEVDNNLLYERFEIEKNPDSPDFGNTKIRRTTKTFLKNLTDNDPYRLLYISVLFYSIATVYVNTGFNKIFYCYSKTAAPKDFIKACISMRFAKTKDIIVLSDKNQNFSEAQLTSCRLLVIENFEELNENVSNCVKKICKKEYKIINMQVIILNDDHPVKIPSISRYEKILSNLIVVGFNGQAEIDADFMDVYIDLFMSFFQ